MKLKIFLICLTLLSFINLSAAWEFNGTVRDVDGGFLNNTLVNITIWTMGPTGPSLVGSNSTTSNATGWFNLSVGENSDWMYKPVITQTNATTNAIDYIGQSLPEFPYREFANTSGINFYLKPAGTINMTAVNRTGDRITFRYQVKDTKLGYPIASQFITAVSEAVVYVPRDRNYSIMIYPDQAMPVSFNWNNFSSTFSYNIIAGLSTYNVTTHKVQKIFNSTDNLIRLTGYIQNTTGVDFADWNQFTIVPYLLEPGNMIYLGDNAGMPYNMSAWSGQSDEYNLTSGFYNITLPGPAESATYILFATARNGSRYYGGYKNISLSYSDSPTQLNFTMYPLMATNWGSLNGNISLNDAVSWSNKVNISSAKQQFNLINSSGSIISSLNAHLEIKVDYTNYGALEFTFMTDISSGDASIYLPLLNVTGVKEMNIYSQSYSPKRVGTKTVAQVLNNSNITMTTFSPGDIEGSDIEASVQVGLYISNSTCNLPNPASSCILADSATMDSESEDRFNPLSSIIGGGKINFRMGLLASGIIVEYINVDMLASGPPDALFDDSATTSTSGSFDSAMRFGSNGPTIYDYVIISMPYTEGSTSTTGLNENADVNMSIPTLYDENWNIIWNVTANGTSGTALAGNQSHYSTYSAQWQTLMGNNNCTRNQSEFNSTNPCYMDITNNRIWIRLPHFSGTKPSVTGTVVIATPATTATSTSSTSSPGLPSGAMVYSASLSLIGDIVAKNLRSGDGVKFTIKNESHSVTVKSFSAESVVVTVASTPQDVTIKINETKKVDLDSDEVYDLAIIYNGVLNNIFAKIVVTSISEKMTAEQVTEQKATTGGTTVPEATETGSSKVWWIVGIVIVVIIILIVIMNRKKHRY